jgi:hypothetical protein
MTTAQPVLGRTTKHDCVAVSAQDIMRDEPESTVLVADVIAGGRGHGAGRHYHRVPRVDRGLCLLGLTPSSTGLLGAGLLGQAPLVRGLRASMCLRTCSSACGRVSRCVQE